MQGQSARLVGGFALLVAVWIVTYWAWVPREPRISIAGPSGDDGADRPIDNGELRAAGDPMRGVAGPPEPEEIPTVIPPEFIGYVVLPGDSLEVISAKFYGSTLHAKAIAQANPLMDPTRLKPGRTIRVPKDPGNVQGVPATVNVPAFSGGPVTSYTVQKGDSLTSISKHVYGTIKFADLIYDANLDVMASKDALKVGQILKIPAKPAGGTP
jgi:hypothetical protein